MVQVGEAHLVQDAGALPEEDEQALLLAVKSGDRQALGRAVDRHLGFALPMMVATMGSLVVLVIAVFLGPETRGKVLTADLEIFEKEEYP